MEHPFETPHPSIQTQDQIFKLPSSQPLYSPNLSPVPIATTKSRNLKENKVSTPWTEHTSKTLTSAGRSASVSSSNSSSSMKSKEPQTKKSLKANMKPRSSKTRNSKSGSGFRINLARALASPFVSRASSPINDQGSNINRSHPPPPKPGCSSTATNLGKRGLSDTFYNPNLPSRSQTHTAQGLHEREKGRIYQAQNAHTSPSSKAPASVLLDLNTQLKQKKKRGHHGTVSVDGARGNDAIELDLGGGKTKKKEKGQQRERRPSAPSSYSHRPRPRSLLLLSSASAGSQGNKTRRSRLTPISGGAFTIADIPTAPTATTNHTIEDDGFVLPILPDSHKKNTNSAAAPDMEMDWRVGIVDFNRPPSQMCQYPVYTTLDGWVDGEVLLSGSEESEGSLSESEEDENNIIEGTQNMVNPTRASRMRPRAARSLTSTSGPGSGFDDIFGPGFGFRSVLPSDLNSIEAVNLDLDLNMDIDQSRFGDGAWGISTPSSMKMQRDGHVEEREREKGRKENRMMMKVTSTTDLRSRNGGLVKMRSLPLMGVGRREMELGDYHDIDVNKEEDEQDTYNQEQEQDMDLTTPLMTATADVAAASTTLGATQTMQLVDERGDRTPWIMDSLISPPSQFLKIQGKDGYSSLETGDAECVQEQEHEEDGENLCSEALSSSSPSESNLLSSPFRLSSDQLQSQPATTLSTTTAPATTTFSAKRTRSGTIVPSSHRIGDIPNNDSNNDPPGTRRTRSGTLVGPLPLPLPLVTSGSGVQLAVGDGNPTSVRKTREKIETILAGPSPVGVGVGVGARRTRSGTVIGRPPPPPPPIPVFAPFSLPFSASVPGGRSTKKTGLGPEIVEEDMPTTSNSRSPEPGNIDRADEHLVGGALGGLNSADVDVDVDVEPHVDALYMPRQSPSPDPIDFLRLTHFQDYDGMKGKPWSGSGFTIEEREDEDRDLGGAGIEEGVRNEMAWCIVDEPPSPILSRIGNKTITGRTNIQRGEHGGVKGGVRGSANGKRRQGKGMRGKGRTRFMIDGHEERPDEIVAECEEGEDSDDELLLKDGSTLDIWE
ncbi:hypothetical protein BYT27DRAFT_7310573 [Phlegmacium glaucopus]|nr:hypothetical protein BYT27DRAFT_7310573 [Phlegmacium glaucopus]